MNVGYCVFLSNTDLRSNRENTKKPRIQIHPISMHIINGYRYGYLYYNFKWIQIQIIWIFRHPFPPLLGVALHGTYGRKILAALPLQALQTGWFKPRKCKAQVETF